MTGRLALVIATQCRAMPYLDGLPDAAARLHAGLLDPAAGACAPALPDGRSLLGGRPGADEVSSAAIRSAISQAAERAGAAEAVLVLALLGHGFTPGDAPTLHFMGADARDQEGDTAVSVPAVLGYAANQLGVSGVIAVVDTCGGAAAIPPAYELTLGRRRGQARLAILAGSGAAGAAYGMRLSRELAAALAAGLPGGPATLTVERLAEELADRIPGQDIVFSAYGGPTQAAGSLWLARNRTAVPDEPAERPDDRAYRSMCRAYLEWAVSEWRYIDLGDLGAEPDAPDAERVRMLPLQQMYISLQADPRSVADRQRQENLRQLDEHDTGPDVARTMSQRENREAILARGPRAASGPEPGSDAGLPLDDAFARHRILVVLGDPGSGKSVLCLWLGCQVAGETREALARGREGRVRVPLLFRAADYARYYERQFAAGERPRGIAEFLASRLHEAVGYPARQLRGMFERALADGEAVLLIDGLDELTVHRHEVVDALARLVEAHVAGDRTARSQAVITSRVEGYDDVYLTIEEAAHYLIRPMTPEQTRTFTARFFRELGAAEQAPLLLRHLAGSTSDVVMLLAANPLLLTSMCSYWHRHRELPASRPALYRQLLLDTAFRWRGFAAASGSSELDRLLASENDFLAMLARVAVRIHEEHADGRIGLEELLDALDDALYGIRRYTRVDARAAARELVSRIRAKVGILAETAAGEFGFIHQTFREYLAGHDLLRGLSRDARPAAGELCLRLRGRIGDPRWREPVLLLLGECTAAIRVGLMSQVRDSPGLDLDEWTEMFLAAALERPVADSSTAELTGLLALAMQAAELVRGLPDLPGELDAQLGRLRRHLGPERFDFLAMSLFAEDAAMAPAIAALYWRRQWLTAGVLAALAAAPQHDTPEWDWPIQRALRRAGGPKPLKEIVILAGLKQPQQDADTNSREALRRYELGRRAWEDQRAWSLEQAIEEPGAGVLPLRELFRDQPARWLACLSDLGSASVLGALFGGLDHHDALRWAAEYDDFARLLSLDDTPRRLEVERRAAELVPRFGVDDTVYSIAVWLDTTGSLVTRAFPVPSAGTEWLTGPSTPAVRDVVRRWALRAPGDPVVLRRGLRQLAATAADPGDRAEAELGLLVLDSTRMTGDAASARALRRALEATGDAMIRGHAAWLRAIWDPAADLTDAERAALHRFLLRTVFLVAGGPVPLDPDPLSLHPAPYPAVLQADHLARQLLARSWGRDVPTGSVTAEIAPQRLPAVLAWLATLPYQDLAGPSGQARAAPPWHEDMPGAAGGLSGLMIALRPLLAWAHEQEPRLEPDLSAAVGEALDVAAADLAAAGPDPEIAGLHAVLEAGRGSAGPDVRQQIVAVAQAAATGRTDLACLLVALSLQVPEPEQLPWQAAALDVLAREPSEELRAEALWRFRGYLGDDPGLRQQLQRIVGTISSPVLRADAAGDLGQTARALISRAGAGASPADRISLLIVATILAELSRIAGLASPAPDARPGLPGADLVPGLDEPWRLDLTQDALSALDPVFLASADNDEDAAGWLSMVSRVEAGAVEGLTALIGRAPPGARWAAAARDVLALQRAAADGGYPGMFRDLVAMAAGADAVLSARAHLELLGPVRDKTRSSRRYSLSRYGLDLWWDLGRAAATEADPYARRLYQAALDEWQVDDEAAVALAAGRARRDPAVWHELLPTASIWSAGAQEALARCLDSAPADAAEADACLQLIAMLASRNDPDVAEDERVEPRLVQAVVSACTRSGVAPRTVPGLAAPEWRLGVAPFVAAAGVSAGAAATGPRAVGLARELLRDQTVPVIEAGSGQADLAGYGNLIWVPLGAHPAESARFAPAELTGREAVSVLSGWLLELVAESAGDHPMSRLDLATHEALLSLLVVLSARDGAAFRLGCPPPVLQPVLSQAVLWGGSVAASAGLILLSRLRFVDVSPEAGPGLVQVLDAALRGEPEVQETAQVFLRTVRHVRGTSFAQAVLAQIGQSANESIVQGLAGLAAAYLQSPTCSAADRQQIREALRVGALEARRRRAVYLIGVGSTSDPIRPVIGADRQSEFRRLRRGLSPQ